jgi:hypothetical protein
MGVYSRPSGHYVEKQINCKYSERA